MKLEIVGVYRPEALRQLVEFRGDPVSLGLEHGHPAEDEILLGGVPRRPRVI